MDDEPSPLPISDEGEGMLGIPNGIPDETGSPPKPPKLFRPLMPLTLLIPLMGYLPPPKPFTG